MMRRSIFKTVSVVALALSAASCAEGVGGVLDGDEDEALDADSDNATLRRKAMQEWYTESQSSGWTPQYRKFILDAAEREKNRWGDLLPMPEGTFRLALTGQSWVSVGPTKADVAKNGSVSLNVTDSGRLRSIVISPTDPKLIYIATAGGGVWRTTDGGSSWAPMTELLGSLSCGSLAMDPSDSSTLYLGLGDPFDGTGIGLVKSTNGGADWTQTPQLGDATAIPQVVVSPTSPSTVLVATNKGLYRSTDAGAHWSLVNIATGQAGVPYIWSIAWTGGAGFALTLEAAPDATTGTTDGQAWVSGDNGASWTRASGFTSSKGLGRATIASAPSNRQVLYAMAAVPLATSASDLADIFRSTNGGATWVSLNAPKKRFKNGKGKDATLATLLNGQGWYDQLVLVDPANPSVVYFGGALTLARTSDGGGTFYQMSDWLGQKGFPYIHADFHAGAADGAGNLYVGTDGGIFKSTDGGATWTDRLNVGITTHLLYSVGSSVASPDAIIAGLQDNGTRVRAGATTTFNQVIGGDGFGSDIHQKNGQLMLGSLYYDRIYRSSDGGASWTAACSGITECNNSSTAPFLTRIVRWAGSPTSDDVYTFSNKVVYASSSYGSSWSPLGTTGFPADLFIRGVGVARSNKNVIGVVGSGGRVFLSNNGGSSWSPPILPPNNDKSLSDVHFDDANPQIVYVASVAANATKSHLWRSTDFGASWTAIDGNGLPTGVPVNIVRQYGSTIFAGTHLGVYASNDAGATWTRFGADLPLVNITDLYISDDGTLVRAASYGRGAWELSTALQ